MTAEELQTLKDRTETEGRARAREILDSIPGARDSKTALVDIVNSNMSETFDPNFDLSKLKSSDWWQVRVHLLVVYRRYMVGSQPSCDVRTITEIFPTEKGARSSVKAWRRKKPWEVIWSQDDAANDFEVVQIYAVAYPPGYPTATEVFSIQVHDPAPALRQDTAVSEPRVLPRVWAEINDAVNEMKLPGKRRQLSKPELNFFRAIMSSLPNSSSRTS